VESFCEKLTDPQLVNNFPAFHYIFIICLYWSKMCARWLNRYSDWSTGLDGPESNPSGDEIFPPVQTDPGAHPASCKMGTGSFPGVKCGRGVLLNTHPLLVPRSWKSRAITLRTIWAIPGLKRDHFMFEWKHQDVLSKWYNIIQCTSAQSLYYIR